MGGVGEDDGGGVNIDICKAARRASIRPAKEMGGSKEYERGMRRFSLLKLDQLRGLPRVVDQCEPGVYFLWNGPELLYIGMSTSVAGRVNQHKWEKPHTHATFQRASWRCISVYEDRYIWHYGPPLNVRGRAWK